MIQVLTSIIITLNYIWNCDQSVHFSGVNNKDIYSFNSHMTADLCTDLIRVFYVTIC